MPSTRPMNWGRVAFSFLLSAPWWVQGSRKIIQLLRRKEGYGSNAQGQADELIGTSLFLVDKQANQYSASSREHRKEHRAFAQFRPCAQADEPGRVGRDEAEDGEDCKNELPIQSKLFCQDVGD